MRESIPHAASSLRRAADRLRRSCFRSRFGAGNAGASGSRKARTGSRQGATGAQRGGTASDAEAAANEAARSDDDGFRAKGSVRQVFTPSEDSSSEIPPDSSRHKKGPTKPVRQPIRQPRSIPGRIVRGLRRPITQTHEGLPRSFHPSGNRPFGERSRTAARKKERLSNKFFLRSENRVFGKVPE